jgi:hypothetical protein
MNTPIKSPVVRLHEPTQHGFLPSEILNPVCERACIATRRPLIAAAPLVNFATATTPADPHHQRFRREAPHVSPSLPSRLPLLLRTNHVIFDVIAATNIKLQLENNFTVTTSLQKKKRKKQAVSQTFLDLADGFTPRSSAGH